MEFSRGSLPRDTAIADLVLAGAMGFGYTNMELRDPASEISQHAPDFARTILLSDVRPIFDPEREAACTTLVRRHLGKTATTTELRDTCGILTTTVVAAAKTDGRGDKNTSSEVEMPKRLRTFQSELSSDREAQRIADANAERNLLIAIGVLGALTFGVVEIAVGAHRQSSTGNVRDRETKLLSIGQINRHLRRKRRRDGRPPKQPRHGAR